MNTYDYEEVYGNSKKYYWGVNPSEMCMKILTLLPPDNGINVFSEWERFETST